MISMHLCFTYCRLNADAAWLLETKSSNFATDPFCFMLAPKRKAFMAITVPLSLLDIHYGDIIVHIKIAQSLGIYLYSGQSTRTKIPHL